MNGLIEFPDFVPRADKTWNPSNALIPHIFHRIYTDRRVTKLFCYTFQQTANADPTLDFTLVDFPTAEAFISEQCGQEVAWAFRMLLPGAYRADLYRYCVLYATGGYAVDLGVQLKAPIASFVPANATFVVGEDPAMRNEGVWVGFTGSVPRHPLLRACMDKVVDHVKHCWYETPGETRIGPLAITGPELLGDAIRRYLRLAPGDAWPVGDVSSPIVILPSEHDELGHHQFFDPRRQRQVVQDKFPGQEEQFRAMGYMTDASRHYSSLWWSREVYNPDACKAAIEEAIEKAKRDKLAEMQAEIAREDRLRGQARAEAAAAGLGGGKKKRQLP